MFSSVMKSLNERRNAGLEGQEADSGFTLIELMVVLLILAILLAIAIPTFLGVTGSANDRASQANLNTAITDGKSVYENNQQSYPGLAYALATSINTNEPSLNIQTATYVATAGQVTATASSDGGGAIYMSLAKKTGNCWFLVDNTATIKPAVGTLATDAVWNAATTVSSAGVIAGKGVPTVPGEFYGVYAITTTTTSCDPITLDGLTIGGIVLAESTTAFPSAA
jgi:type IV pilus assembly protein PilA